MNFVNLESTRGSKTHIYRSWAFLVGVALIAIILITLNARFVDAATAPSMQFPTSAVTTNGNIVGGTRVMSYGTTGVTLTETIAALTGGCTLGNTTMPGSTANSELHVTEFIEPDFPTSAALPITGCGNGGSRTTNLSFNKSLIAPMLHIVNLDASYLDVGGASTTGDLIGFTTIVKNDAMTITGNRFNSTTEPPVQPGCKANDGTNPNGACGSFRLAATTGLIKDFTFTNAATSGNDGWYWALSFPSVPLTKSFSPASIPAGQTSQLTFTLSNPSEAEAIPLTPLDFTDNLPSGMTVASSATSNNGQCGSPTITDASNGTLAAGSGSIKATNISLAVGATCTITVTVTSLTTGVYTNDNSNMSSSIGNVQPNTTASLTVTDVSKVHYKKTVSPIVTSLTPGQTFTYTVTAENRGTTNLTGLSFTDDLSDVLDDASYNNDINAIGGTVSWDGNDRISWSGNLNVGQTATITYSFTMSASATGNGQLTNSIVGMGPQSNCTVIPATDPDCRTTTSLSTSTHNSGLADTGQNTLSYSLVTSLFIVVGLGASFRQRSFWKSS